MKPRDRKLALLHLLGQEEGSLELNELHAKLNSSFSTRTLRRDLEALVKEGAIEKIGSTKGVKYIAVKTLMKTSTSTISSCFSSKSLKALEYISKPLFERDPLTYQPQWLEDYQPNKSFYLETSLRSKLLQAGQRASFSERAGTYAHQIFNRLLIDLSYNSSRLEGNTYSLLDTEKLLLHGESPEGKLDEEKIMILNHKEAIRYLVETAPHLKIEKNVIFTLHYLLSEGLIEPPLSGKVRNQGVRIGGSSYIPFEKSTKLDSFLQKICLKANEILDPFEQSLFLLIHLSYLQAFIDVNKRTARLSANIPFIKKNLVPLAFSGIEQKDYMTAMIAIYELQDVNPLVDLYVYSYMRTCAAYDSTVKDVSFDEVRVKYRQERRKIIREIISQEMSFSLYKKYMREEAKKVIPDEDFEEFIKDIEEDLTLMDQSRIVGLGVTLEQLKKWKVINQIG